jgi:hypothetical protein
VRHFAVLGFTEGFYSGRKTFGIGRDVPVPAAIPLPAVIDNYVLVIRLASRRIEPSHRPFAGSDLH